MSPGSTISMIISDLELEEQSECVFDSLEVHFLHEGNIKHLLTIYQFLRFTMVRMHQQRALVNTVPAHIRCISRRPTIMPSSGFAQISAIRDAVSSFGLIQVLEKLNFQFEREPMIFFDFEFLADCQKTMTARRGSIESPNFPNAYANNLDCQWTILPQLGNKLYVEFSHFDLEYSGEEEDYAGDSTVNCFDFVTIDEIDAEDKVLNSHKYCNNIPKPIETTRKLVIK